MDNWQWKVDNSQLIVDNGQWTMDNGKLIINSDVTTKKAHPSQVRFYTNLQNNLTNP
jgi:hypothetical protein